MFTVKNEFEKTGFAVETLGLDTNKGSISDKDLILLPVPFTRDGVNINCPLTGDIIPIDLLCSLPEKTKVFGGGKLRIKNYTDYLSLNEYAIKNAVLTAEGAIAFAIENSGLAVWQSKILVIGYGRVGKILADRLCGFKPRLTVSARSASDFAMLDAAGINRIRTDEIDNRQSRFDIVFNTVDIKFSPATAKTLKNCLFLDLSTCGGFDDGVIQSTGLLYRKLPGIPAKVSSEKAGKIIAETVISNIS